jgi:hypothetical protein
MSSGTAKRGQALAIRVAKLKADGLTHRAIAEVVGKKPEQIKGLVLLGERLMNVQQ